MKSLELHADDKTIRFTVENADWCKMYLNDNEEDFPLGADSLEIILSRLLIGFLSVPDRKYFTYQDKQMFSIVSLSDPHSVIAGRDTADHGLELLFLGIDDDQIHSIVLTIEDKQKWICEIMTFLCKKYVHR